MYDPVQYRNAIARIESGGRYGIVGPTHPRMGRALGKYQIMEANLGPWAQAALGRTVGADEFLANPQIQDAIFDNRFGGYVKQYGPEGAAQAWFAGPGGVGKTNRKDVLGTDVGSYGRKFMDGLGAPDPYANMPDGPKGQEGYAPQPSIGNTQVASIWGGGESAPVTQSMAEYALGDEQPNIWERLGAIGKSLDDSIPAPPSAGGSYGGPGGSMLAQVLNQPNLGDTLLQRRLGFLKRV